MKNVLILIVVMSFIQLAYAQKSPTPPQAPSTSHSSHQQKIEIDIEKNKKLKLSVDDHQFKLNLKFPKRHVGDVQRVFASHFPTANNDKYEWSEMNKNSKIQLRKNKLEVYYKKGKISEGDLHAIKAFTEETLTLLDWDTEDLGLWNYMGDWSLNKTD